MPVDHDHSLFARKFNIPSITSDPVRWAKIWDKALSTLASEDVYSMLSQIWNQDRWEPAERLEQAHKLNVKLSSLQETLVKLWDTLEKMGQFLTAWLMLGAVERKRHVLKGLEGACEHASRGQDLRALCPEITLKLILKEQGKGFKGFISDYSKGKKSVGRNAVYLLPSEWWEKAVDAYEPLTDDVEFAFRLLTIQRNEFISRFLLNTIQSVVRDMTQGSPQMDPVINIMSKCDGWFSDVMAKMMASMRDKPLIRCENCDKNSEEAERNVKFMVCARCKAKLDFAVHYCSSTCQKEDWPSHKRRCGKEKVLKNIRGTAADPTWAQKGLPGHLPPPLPDANGKIPIIAYGFGTPHPSRPHSPALRRQVALINADKEADYFLFDERDRPIRVVIPDMLFKQMFRTIRADVMFTAQRKGLETIAEYLIKLMGQTPGLSRPRILNQFAKEYGRGIPAKIAQWERAGVMTGCKPGITALEMMARNMAMTGPWINNAMPK